MTKITVVTTFHNEGLLKYGQRFLDSFAKNVDKPSEDALPYALK